MFTLLLACGGDQRPDRPAPPPLVEGTAAYQVRYNPAACLTDRRLLHAEVKTPRGWERVALEDADEELPLVQRLLDQLNRQPDELVWVRADLTDRAVSWSGNHAARVLSLLALDVEPPPPEPEE